MISASLVPLTVSWRRGVEQRTWLLFSPEKKKKKKT
jgi:hypothetical protein